VVVVVVVVVVFNINEGKERCLLAKPSLSFLHHHPFWWRGWKTGFWIDTLNTSCQGSETLISLIRRLRSEGDRPASGR